MTEPRAFRGWQGAQWLEKAVCPGCGEANTPHKKQMIDLSERGEAYCNKCGVSWRPDNGALRGDSKL